MTVKEAAQEQLPATGWSLHLHLKLRHRLVSRLLRSPQVLLGSSVLIFLIAVSSLAPFLTSYDPIEISPLENLGSPSLEHPMGTDQFGRDVMSRVLYGGRLSLTIGLLALASAFGIGITIGMVTGFYGGWLDFVIMRMVDVMLAFPAILLGLVVVTMLGPSLRNVMIAIGVSWSPTYIRFVRGLVIQLRVKDYIEASWALGASNGHVLIRHVLPNVLPSLIVFASLALGGTILAAAGLSFLGLGAQPPTPEWGTLLNNGRDYLRHAWWIMAFPGIAITLSVVGSNLLGDGLRDVLDPTLKL